MGRRRKPESVAIACASGDVRRAFVAVRDHVSALLDVETDSRIAAQLSAELRKVLNDLAALDAAVTTTTIEKVNSIDELAGKRTRRRAAAISDGVAGSII